jgi:putative protease
MAMARSAGQGPATAAPPTELLAPARDPLCGRVAVDCGADALYVGPPRFGARAAAGNSLDDIAGLAEYAHRYWVRVYAALNTLLTDDEVPAAVGLAHELYRAGVDGLIVQDVGLLSCDLPPLPLIASTQMHNHTAERVAFLAAVGFRRVILARELSLTQIAAIHAAVPAVELEAFVHGALCVCFSGQCSLSYAQGGRSGNRGECAQPCRQHYRLTDADGRELTPPGHLLSLADLSLADHLPDLLAAGVTSFKIEGRLKDELYLRNVVTLYRRRLDQALATGAGRRSSSGTSAADFEPDADCTFNRGFTSYFIAGRRASPGRVCSPKMIGQPVGRVAAIDGRNLQLDGADELSPGDGLCFFDDQGQLRGTQVEAVQGRRITVSQAAGLRPGVEVRRNAHHRFLRRLGTASVERRIEVGLVVSESEAGLVLTATDEDGNQVQRRCETEPVAAHRPDAAAATARKQLSQAGSTVFAVRQVQLAWQQPWFLPVAEWNRWRRQVLEALSAARAQHRPRLPGRGPDLQPRFPTPQLDYLGNVLNRRAEAFYRAHGVTDIEPAAEAGLDLTGRKVMTTRYCLRHQLGQCQGRRAQGVPPPLYLTDDAGRRLEARFDCQACQMEIYLPGAAPPAAATGADR